jgi:hypothetical protein
VGSELALSGTVFVQVAKSANAEVRVIPCSLKIRDSKKEEGQEEREGKIGKISNNKGKR